MSTGSDEGTLTGMRKQRVNVMGNKAGKVQIQASNPFIGVPLPSENKRGLLALGAKGLAGKTCLWVTGRHALGA